jgi:hypothetical protein
LILPLLLGAWSELAQAAPAESIEITRHRIAEGFALVFRKPRAERVNLRIRGAPGKVVRRVIDGRDRGVVV